MLAQKTETDENQRRVRSLNAPDKALAVNQEAAGWTIRDDFRAGNRPDCTLAFGVVLGHKVAVIQEDHPG